MTGNDGVGGLGEANEKERDARMEERGEKRKPASGESESCAMKTVRASSCSLFVLALIGPLDDPLQCLHTTRGHTASRHEHVAIMRRQPCPRSFVRSAIRILPDLVDVDDVLAADGVVGHIAIH